MTDGPAEDDLVYLTGDELTAVARGLGAPAFPGVLGASYAAAPVELHDALDRQLLDALCARGLLSAGDGGSLRPAGAFGRVVDALVRHRSYVAVDQTRPATAPGLRLACAVIVGERGLVRHWPAGPYHGFEPDPSEVALSEVDGGRPGGAGAGTRLADVLHRLISRSPGAGRPGRRPVRGVRPEVGTTIENIVPAPAGGWLRATVLERTDDAGAGVRVAGHLGVLDGGPGELWLVTAADDGDTGPVLRADPAAERDVDAAVREFAAHLPLPGR